MSVECMYVRVLQVQKARWDMGVKCHRTRRQVPKTLYKQSHQSRHFIISRSTVCILTTSCTGGEKFEGSEQPRSCCRTRRSPEFSRTVAVLEVSAVFCTSSFLGTLPLDHFYWSCSMEYDCILRHQPCQKLCAALWNGMTRLHEESFGQVPSP